jgi:anthranilate phosphoribosyltransferase
MGEMLKEILNKLVTGKDLSILEMEKVFDDVMGGNASDAQIGAIITALRMKKETIEEITGAARIMRKFATKVPVKNPNDALDTCGTGGDSSHTFNISTATAIVAASCGVPVAKHGNRSVSSKCGSADVLKELGVNIEIGPDKVAECIDKVNIGFLFAPKLHGAMKYAIGPRRELGIRTIFNVLGPLTNPAGAKRQLLGVYSEDLVKPLASVLNNLGSLKVMVVHGKDGLDEITTTDSTYICEYTGGVLKEWYLDPKEFGFDIAKPKDLTGGSVEHNANIIRDIFSGKTGPQRDIVILNSAAAIYVAGKSESIKDGISIAVDAIETGKAKSKLDELIKISNS